MIPANDILARKKEIKGCIAAADMERAIKRLMDLVHDFWEDAEDDVILISRRYYDLKKRDRLKTIEFDQLTRNENIIAKDILDILRDLGSNLGQVS